MREGRTFAERTKVLKSDEAIKKYFLVYEGSDTEVIYFDAIRFLREDIGINFRVSIGYTFSKYIILRNLKKCNKDEKYFIVGYCARTCLIKRSLCFKMVLVYK